MNRALWGFAASLCFVGVLAAGGLVWPIASGYFLSLGHKDTIITEPRTTYDRAPLMSELAAEGLALGEEAHVRIFKRERVLELWIKKGGERFVLFKSYAICTFSGQLG